MRVLQREILKWRMESKEADSTRPLARSLKVASLVSFPREMVPACSRKLTPGKVSNSWQ